MQYVTGRGNAFFAFDKETDATADDQRHLFVRMGVLRRGQQRRESKAADHQILTDDHLTLDAFRWMLDWNTGPIQIRYPVATAPGTDLIRRAPRTASM